MVSASENEQNHVIVARPNLSASWQHNKQILFLLSIPSLGAALFFTSLGAWPILPFAGLELAALGSALYYVHWKLHFRHVITFDSDIVRIDKGVYAPKFTYKLVRREAGLAITPERHPWDGPELYIQDRTHSIRVGEFLNREDCLALKEHLNKHIRISSSGPNLQRSV